MVYFCCQSEAKVSKLVKSEYKHLSFLMTYPMCQYKMVSRPPANVSRHW